MELINRRDLISAIDDLKIDTTMTSWGEGFNDAIRDCYEAILKAEVTHPAMPLKASESDSGKGSNDNTIKALKAVKETLDNTYDTEEAISFIDGMLTALEM